MSDAVETQAEVLPAAPRKKKARGSVNAKVVSAKQINTAMEKSGGVLQIAAAMLEVSVQHLRYRISKTPWLKIKFTGAGLQAVKLEAIVADSRTVFEKQINSAYNTLGQNSQRVIKQIDAIENRLALGE